MIILGLILTALATIICTVKLLKPAHLTPIACEVANNLLKADVSMSRLELSFEPAFPMLRVEIDSLTVISNALDTLMEAEKAALPAWTDSLMTVDHFGGTINVASLLTRNEIALSNVLLDGAGINIVLTTDGPANFDIYTPSADTDTTQVSQMPSFSIDHFAFERPKDIRFFNQADSTTATIVLLREIRLDSDSEPTYSIRVDGHMLSPLTKQVINLDDMSFALDGKVHWHPHNPSLLTFEQFTVKGAFVQATLDTQIALDSTLTINTGRLAVPPLNLTDLLTLLPDDVRAKNRLVAPYFVTDATVSLTAELTSPFRPSIDSIPTGTLSLSVPPCKVKYGKARLREFALDLEANLPEPDLDAAVADIRQLVIAGPATRLDIAGTVRHPMSDPAFNTCIKGDIDLANLPAIVADMAKGYISGRLSADIDADGTMSMLDAEHFHMLDLRGRLEGDNLFYLSNDTNKMAEIQKLKLAFGSKIKARNDSAIAREMLAGGLKVDTATLLIDGVNISLSDLALGFGTENSAPKRDTTLVVPLGGGIKLGRLNVISITDSAGMRLRGLAGKLSLRRFKHFKRLPEIIANLEIDRLSAGTLGTRFVLSKAKLEASTHKIPMPKEVRRDLKRLTDSIHRQHPDIAPDSVFKLAVEKRRHKPGVKRPKRVHGELSAQDVEVLEWGLSKGFKKFLFGWELKGTLSTRNARLFTPAFPLRNRVSRLDIAFSNDSIAVNSLRYRAGRSDLVVSGLISNLRKGLTSKSVGNSLKINFDIVSDTIDVNQLAAATFAGAAYMERVRRGQAEENLGHGDDSDLEERIDALASQSPDSIGPLLIPANIDASLRLRANNIMYADLDMKDLYGDVLMYDGGVNLHQLSARSDAGNLNFTALYSAPKPDNIKMGFGLDISRFNIERFLALVPAVDSVLPIIRDFRGIIDAELAATVDIDSSMNMILPTLDAAVRLTGDSLAFIDPKTYAMLGKWLRFRDRSDNYIKHMNVEMIVRDNQLRIFPFSFDIDRYRLGIAGYNDLNMNFDYHIAVLKSPLPFKFGITIKGNPDKFKVRFGGSKFKEGQVAESVNVVDTARVNLIQQIEGVFRRGVSRSRFARLNVNAPDVRKELEEPDTGLSAADSLALIKEGLIEAPKPIDQTDEQPADNKKRTGLFRRKNRK